jgi:hypothetical protein
MRYASSAGRIGILAATLAGFPGATHAQDLYVICHPSVSLSAGDLRDVFLGEKQFAGSIRLAPADNSAAHASFLQKVLKMEPSKYLTAWTKKSFRDGVNPPVLSGNDTEALEYVKRAPGRCSYVTTAPGPGVSVVARF